MVTKEKDNVNLWPVINLSAFYISASISLFLLIVGEYQKSMFDLIIALCNLYMYFDWKEIEDGI